MTDVNDVDEDGGTALHFAARYKRMRLAHSASHSTALSVCTIND